MNKYKILMVGFLATSPLSYVWAAPVTAAQPGMPNMSALEAGELPPPPPPPPPERDAVGSAKTIAQRIVAMANDVLKNHNNFVNAEVAYLKDQNPGNKATMDAAASSLGDSLAALKRLVSRMEKDMSASVKAEIEDVKTEVSKSKLPPKNQEQLMNELREKLRKRAGETGDNVASPSE